MKIRELIYPQEISCGPLLSDVTLRRNVSGRLGDGFLTKVARRMVSGRLQRMFFLAGLTLCSLAAVPDLVLADQDAAGVKLVEKRDFSYDVVTLLTTDDLGENLKMPSGLFYDRRADELYLLNGGDSRIIVYGSDYFPQESLGKGRGIEAPQDGTFNAEGNILIPQRGVSGQAPRITIVNSAFLPVKEISLAGVPNLDAFTPQHIAVAENGEIYLVGLETARVLILSADGEFSRWMTVPIGAGGEYQARGADQQGKSATIRNLEVDALGNIFLMSEETSKTYVFDRRGTFLFSFGTKGGAEGKLSRPRALVVDEKKKCIYVVDYMRHAVLIYDFTGTFRYEFGGLGRGAGWFNYPVDIALGPLGHLIVADFFNQRAQVFAVNLPDFPDRPPALWQAKPLDGDGK